MGNQRPSPPADGPQAQRFADEKSTRGERHRQPVLNTKSSWDFSTISSASSSLRKRGNGTDLCSCDLGVDQEGTLRYFRSAGVGTASLRPAGRVRYRRDDVQSWIAEQERASRVGALRSRPLPSSRSRRRLSAASQNQCSQLFKCRLSTVPRAAGPPYVSAAVTEASTLDGPLAPSHHSAHLHTGASEIQRDHRCSSDDDSRTRRVARHLTRVLLEQVGVIVVR